MAQWWKVKRELRRLGQQFMELKPLAMGPMNRAYYDLFLSKNVKVRPGLQPAREDLAVVLIYQPDGVLASTFAQLDHLLEHGVAPVVVSNATLSGQDLERLKSQCFLVIERPNFGYDFGGYRDAILALFEMNVVFQNLFVLNDSIWFPVRANCTLLQHARNSDVDLFGIFYTKKSKRKSHWHVHSYFYRFGPNIVSSDAFQSYWRRMPLYQGHKGIVIRQFEIKLTGYFKARGFSTGSLFEEADIRASTHSLSLQETQDLVNYNLSADELTRSFFQSMEGLTPDDPEWSTNLEKIIEHKKFGNYFLHAHPWVFLDRLQSPILKKNRDRKFVAQRKEVFSTGLDATLLPVVREEVRTWDD